MSKNQELKEMIANKVSNVISDLIDEEIESHRKKGLPFYEKDIINKMGISKSAFTHYKNGNDGKGKEAKPKMPDLVSLYKIHNYFNVPYSYLLDETPTKDIDNLSIGINLGLNDLSIERLSKLNKLKNNPKKEFELFVINALISNEEFTKKISRVVMEQISSKVLNDEMKEKYNYSQSEKLEFYKYKLTTLMNDIVENIANSEDIPKNMLSILMEKPILTK